MGRPLINILHRSFGRLTVIGGPFGENFGDRKRYTWLCQCTCGSKTQISSAHLLSGDTRSCGCLRREVSKAKNFIHGKRKAPEFLVWGAMRQRCNNPESKSYHNYGARGIKVCERWQTSFKDFYADMGPRPTSTHTLERIDNDGPYSPENCRWATRQEQGNNQRDNFLITFQGKKMTIRNAMNISGVKIRLSVVYSRIRMGWSIERAFYTAVRHTTSED